MATLWVSSIAVTWAPILTFERRRSEVLEWVESNLDPVAFSESDRGLGLAFGHSDMRISFTRHSLMLSSGASGGGMESHLDEALKGILDALTPAQTRVSSIMFKASGALEGAGYDVTRRRFAERAHGEALGLGEWRTKDAAVLSDIETDDFEGQVDYGVVEQSEIRERVLDPGLGRTGSSAEAASPRLLDLRLADAPAVSVFADALVIPLSKDYVASSADIWRTYATAESQVLDLADSLTAAIATLGGSDE